ncbi:MAG: hypothetical protein GBQ79_08710 [Halomonas sp.]|nr:hypothetical protein [Halomonas sp.]
MGWAAAARNDEAAATFGGSIGNAGALLRGCAPLTPRYGYIANIEYGGTGTDIPVARRND